MLYSYIQCYINFFYSSKNPGKKNWLYG